MFVDTSAIVSIFCREDDHLELLGRAQQAEILVTSGLVLLEASMRISTMFAEHPRRSCEAIAALLDELEVAIVPIERDDGEMTVQAFAKYGKGRGHPARLNLADCLSYACAKNRGVALLYKGGDFAETDLR